MPRQALGAEDEQLFGRRADLPICFAIRHANNQGNRISKSKADTVQTPLRETTRVGGTHLIVLQHGYQGSSYDLRLCRDMMAFLFRSGSEDTKRDRERLVHREHAPRCFRFLIAVANEKLTDGNIAIMGQRLAKEVKRKILDINQSESPLGLVIRRALAGSVIIRSALTYAELALYLQDCVTVFDFSTPRLFLCPWDCQHSCVVSTAVAEVARSRAAVAIGSQ